METKLTPKQELFIEHYLANGYNGTQAAISAGYSQDTAQQIASENLSKPLIKEAIDIARGLTIKKVQVTKESLIQDLIDIKESCKDDKKVVHNSIKAVEVINKMLGFNLPDKIETSGGIVVTWNESKSYDAQIPDDASLED
jgi:phage terminase small subunit